MPKKTSYRVQEKEPKEGGGDRTHRAWDAQNYIRSLDSFAKDVPAFNIGGDSQVQTLVGGCLTLLIIILTFSYAASKMIDLSQKKDPFITQSVEQGYYTATNGLNLNAANFRFAIGVTGYDAVTRNDPRYVKWIARVLSLNDGKETEIVLPLNKCTQDDFSNFYPLDADY